VSKGPGPSLARGTVEIENYVGIAKAIFILPAVFWLIGQFGMPLKYWRDARLAPDPDRMDRRIDRWKFYAGMAVMFIGLMVIAYDAADAIMDWMPRSWGGVDEGDEWRPIRPSLQFMVAFAIAGSIIQISGNRAEAAAKWPTDHDFALTMIEELEGSYKSDESAHAYRARLARAGQRVLTRERYDDSNDLKRYRTRLAERLRQVEREADIKLDLQP